MADSGVIIKGLGGLYTVAFEGRLYSCPARGIFRKDNFKPMIGDRVELSEMTGGGTAVIQNILPRKNRLVRPAVANADQVAVVMAARSPAPDLLLVDKLLVSARKNGIEVAMIINKVDQDPQLAAEWKSQYENACDRVVLTCAGMGQGAEELRPLLEGKITVLAGQSGAGKSSVLNLILGDDAMATGSLSRKTDRGRHTTRHNEMFVMDERSFIIDSPGFSLFEMEEMEASELMEYYPEINSHEGECFFQDCSHTGEPRCYVQGLLEDGSFHRARYERYVQLYKELKEREKKKYK